LKVQRCGRMVLQVGGRGCSLPYFTADLPDEVPKRQRFPDNGELRHLNVTACTREDIAASVTEPLSKSKTVVVVGTHDKNPWANDEVAVYVSD